MSDGKRADSSQIDLDSLEVEILILCKNPAAFQQAASYLSRRGWPTTIVGNLNKAIDQVVKTNPDFVLVSFNHPNPGAQRLPGILAQASNTTVIGFTETPDAVSNSRLNASSMRYKIQGLPTGTNIQRIIRKILIEMQNPTEDDEMASSSAESALQKHGRSIEDIVNQAPSDDEDTVSTGSYTMGRKKPRKKLRDLLNTANASAPSQEGASPSPVSAKVDRKKLVELLGDESKDVRGESGMLFLPSKEETPRGNNEITQQRGRNARNGPAYMPTGSDAEGEDSIHQQRGPGGDGKFDPITQEGPGGDGKFDPITQEGPGGGGKFDPITQEGPGGGGKFDPITQSGQAHKGGHTLLQGDRPKGDRIIGKAELIEAFRGSSKGVVSVGKKQSEFDRAGVLEKSIESALTQVCKPLLDGEVGNHLVNVEVVGVLPIDSPDLHGYLLVCASQIEASHHVDFLKTLRAAVGSTFRENGISADIDLGFVITMESFKYHDWVSQESTISFVTYHEKHEIGVSFLPTERRVPKPIEADRADMAQIPLAQIDTDQPVNFKTYLHLKKNGKYFLYLRNGRTLFPTQKERLLKGKVKDVFIKAVDIQNYRTYSAASFISRTIRKTKRAA